MDNVSERPGRSAIISRRVVPRHVPCMAGLCLLLLAHSYTCRPGQGFSCQDVVQQRQLTTQQSISCVFVSMSWVGPFVLDLRTDCGAMSQTVIKPAGQIESVHVACSMCCSLCREATMRTTVNNTEVPVQAPLTKQLNVFCSSHSGGWLAPPSSLCSVFAHAPAEQSWI